MSAPFSSVLLKPWISPGPTVDRFMASVLVPLRNPAIALEEDPRFRARTKALVGPVGGGKTTGVMGGTLLNAAQQPMWADGVRRYICLLVYSDYRRLWSQFMPTWNYWWPADAPGVEQVGSNNNPVDVTLRLQWPAPIGNVDYKLLMRAIGELTDPEAIDAFFRGTPVNDIWSEEGDLQPQAVFDKGFTRMGRAPPRSVDGFGAVARTFWYSSNQTPIGSWPHQFKMSGKWRRDIELYEQPAGDGPHAENLHNLAVGYYRGIIENSDEATIRRLVKNLHTLRIAGKPVFPEFDDLRHVAPFEPDRRLPLRIGMDGGQTVNPAAAFGQRGVERRLGFSDEIAPEHGTGAEEFGDLINKMLGHPRYSSHAGDRRAIIATVDLSAQFGAAKGELTWIQRVEAKTGLRIRASRTNALTARRGALRRPMKEHLGLFVDPRCQTLREGLGGLFHYPRIMTAGGRFSDTPAKNHSSHVCEAAEYLAMDDEELAMAEGREAARAKRGRRQTAAVSDGHEAEFSR